MKWIDPNGEEVQIDVGQMPDDLREVACVTWPSGAWVEYARESDGALVAVRSNHPDFADDREAFLEQVGRPPKLLRDAILDALLTEGES